MIHVVSCFGHHLIPSMSAPYLVHICFRQYLCFPICFWCLCIEKKSKCGTIQFGQFPLAAGRELLVHSAHVGTSTVILINPNNMSKHMPLVIFFVSEKLGAPDANMSLMPN
jgi:hypothetical protein